MSPPKTTTELEAEVEALKAQLVSTDVKWRKEFADRYADLDRRIFIDAAAQRLYPVLCKSHSAAEVWEFARALWEARPKDLTP